jgi:hypothetical protein
MCARIARSVALGVALLSTIASSSACAAHGARPLVGRDLDATPCTARPSKGPSSLASGREIADPRSDSCFPRMAAHEQTR